jgi:hypothetical protein
LLRVDYEGATYSYPVVPQQGVSNIEITVYDAAPQGDLMTVREHAIFVHPSGGTLVVLEQILLENSSNPPKTYINAKGTFPFTLPGSPDKDVQVTVEGPGGMPIAQTPERRDSKNSFYITYPIRPGETQVRLQYALPYQAPFQFSKRLDVPPVQMHIVTPGKQVQLSGAGVTPLGPDTSTGFEGYAVTPKDNVVALQITGEAPRTATPGSDEGLGEETNLVPIPTPLSERRWWIVSGAGLVMLAGLVYLYKKP